MVYRTRGAEVKNINKIGRSKLSVEFFNPEAANTFLDNPILREKNLSATIPSFRVIRSGIIKDIPTDFSPEDLVASIESSAKILSATRLNRKIRNEQGSSLVPSRSVLVKFEGQILPSAVSIFKVRHPVLPYIPKVQICFSCFRFGHIGANCRGKTRCSRCGGLRHADMSECDRASLPPICINCKGEHLPTQPSCPAYVKQKQIQVQIGRAHV